MTPNYTRSLFAEQHLNANRVIIGHNPFFGRKEQLQPKTQPHLKSFAATFQIICSRHHITSRNALESHSQEKVLKFLANGVLQNFFLPKISVILRERSSFKQKPQKEVKVSTYSCHYFVVSLAWFGGMG